jgi:hypothetical protein
VEVTVWRSIFLTDSRSISVMACLLMVCGCAYLPHSPSTAGANVQLQDELEPLELEIQGMQEEVNILKRGLQKEDEAMGRVMGPEWHERLRAARESAYWGWQYGRDLRASKAIFSRKLKALKAESKVYRDYILTERRGDLEKAR